MMRYMFQAVLVAGAAYLGMGLCQQGWAQDYEEAEINVELRAQQLELERMEGEVAFENQMRELDLEGRRVEIDLLRDATPSGHEGGGGAVVLLLIVAHILMAVWVYGDNRRRDTGYGIWIFITLLVGFFGALVYVVIRLGDMTESPPAPTRSTAAKK